MKKRLFISSILMTLVLLVAITTATFAWYSATTGGVSIGSITSDDQKTVQTANLEYQLSNVTVNNAITLDVQFSSGTMELAHKGTDSNVTPSEGNHGLVTGYLDQSGTLHEVADPKGSSNVLFKTITVTANFNTNVIGSDGYTDASTGYHWTQQQMLDYLKAQTITVTVANKDSSRARFIAAGDNTVAADNDATTSISFDINLSDLTTSAGVSGTCLVYVLGDAASSDGASGTGTGAGAAVVAGIVVSAQKK